MPEAVLEHFHFLRPGWSLLVLPWLAIAWVRGRQRAQRDLFGGIIAAHLLEHLRLTDFRSRWFNPGTVSPLIVLLLIVLLMGPSWRQQPSPLSEDESALVVLLDVSRSMQQRDVQPSRLERAKQKVSDLLALRSDKKTALVAFSGSAHNVLSLTYDHDILGQYLAAIEPSIMPRGGKFPEYALPLVDDILRESAGPATIMLISDGLGADSADLFADWFETRGHQLLVLGVGSEQVPEGAIPLERDALAALADNSGGHYLELTVDNTDMRRASRRIDSHYVIVEDSALPWLDSGYWLVYPTLALFLLWFRRGWTLTWAWLLAPWLLLTSPAPAYAQEPAATTGQAAGPSLVQRFANLWLTGDQQGRILLQLGRYPGAAQRFDDPLWKGMAHYHAEQFMLAAEYFSRSDSEMALFNEANARAHARDYLRALSRYDRLLARNADFPGAAANRARVQELVDEINRLSASQQQEAGVSGEDKALGGEDAIPALGADELAWQEAELSRLSAEEILQDPATREMWLRSVQQDPADFLAIKFGMQLQNRDREAGL